MKKRLLALAAMMLCVVMMLSSCTLFTPNLKFKKLIQKDAAPEAEITLTNGKKLDVKGTTSGDYSIDSSNVVVFVDNSDSSKTTTVYNVATGETIWSATDTEDAKYTVDFKKVYANDETIVILFVYEKGKEDAYKVTVYSENGKEIVALNDIDLNTFKANAWAMEDLLCVKDKLYRISEDGNANAVGSWSELRTKPEYLEKAGDYYVYLDEYSVVIYDSSLNVTATYDAPMYDSASGVSGYVACPLSNGNVIVQYRVYQDIMSKKYDFLMNGNKYKLYTTLIQAKNGKTKDLNLDYVLEGVVYDGLEAVGLNEKVDNYAIAYAIEDKYVNRNINSAKAISLTNKGRVAGVFEIPAPGVSWTSNFELVAQNRWMLSTTDGRNLLLNEKGKVIGEIPYVENANANFFLEDNKIYDWDLNVKLDLNEQKAENIVVMNNSVLFENEDGEQMIYTKDGVKNLTDKDEPGRSFTRLSGGAYMITDATEADAKYEIYNDQGTLLFTITDSVYTPVVEKTAENGALLLSAQLKDGTGTVYYRVV